MTSLFAHHATLTRDSSYSSISVTVDTERGARVMAEAVAEVLGDGWSVASGEGDKTATLSRNHAGGPNVYSMSLTASECRRAPLTFFGECPTKQEAIIDGAKPAEVHLANEAIWEWLAWLSRKMSGRTLRCPSEGLDFLAALAIAGEGNAKFWAKVLTHGVAETLQRVLASRTEPELSRAIATGDATGGKAQIVALMGKALVAVRAQPRSGHVRGIVFVHRAASRVTTRSGSVNALSEDGIKSLRKALAAVTTAGYHVVIFDDFGWKEAVLGLSAGARPAAAADSTTAANGGAAGSPLLWCGAELRDYPGVSILNAENLKPLLQALVNRYGSDRIKLWILAGGGGGYDQPKVVEALFVRGRVFGKSIPVFRLHWDAMFSESDDGAVTTQQELVPNLDAAAHRYKSLKDAGVATFAFSAEWAKGGTAAWYSENGVRPWPACAIPYDPNANWPLGSEVLDMSRFTSGLADLGLDVKVMAFDEAMFVASNAFALDVAPLSSIGRAIGMSSHALVALAAGSPNMVQAAFPRRVPDVALPRADRLRRDSRTHNFSERARRYTQELARGLLLDACILDPKVHLEGGWARSKMVRRLQDDEHGELIRALRAAQRAGRFSATDAVGVAFRLRDAARTRLAHIADAWGNVKVGQPTTFASEFAENAKQFLEGKGTPGAKDVGTLLDELVVQLVNYLRFSVAWPGMVSTVRHWRPDHGQDPFRWEHANDSGERKGS